MKNCKNCGDEFHDGADIWEFCSYSCAEDWEKKNPNLVKFEVCPRCEGRGTHVNPSIDENGITGEEMEELGDEFREDYFAGHFDVRCYECGGKRVVSPAAEQKAWSNAIDEKVYRMESGAWRMGL